MSTRVGKVEPLRRLATVGRSQCSDPPYILPLLSIYPNTPTTVLEDSIDDKRVPAVMVVGILVYAESAADRRHHLLLSIRPNEE